MEVKLISVSLNFFEPIPIHMNYLIIIYVFNSVSFFLESFNKNPKFFFELRSSKPQCSVVISLMQCFENRQQENKNQIGFTIFKCGDIVSKHNQISHFTDSTGCSTWIATKVNKCCDYVFRVRHFSLQIYAGNMCTF